MVSGQERLLRIAVVIATLPLLVIRAFSIRIGTRPSPLALQQARTVADALQKANPFVDVELVILDSKSEASQATQDKPLAMSKVDFVSVIDNHILCKDVDVGVHSLKDIPPSHKWNHPELEFACFLPRACPLDVIVVRDGETASLQSLPQRARVGSASTRRQAQILALRPDLQPVNLRGNVQTRLRHLEEGKVVDALIMARAGLDRLGVSITKNMDVLTPEEMTPGPGQGIVGVVCRKENHDVMELLRTIDDADARIAATVERQVLDTVDAHLMNKPYDGRPPLAAFLLDIGETRGWCLKARLLRPDGSKVVQVEREANRDCSEQTARILGDEAGLELVRLAGDHFFDG